jgi:DNA-directed RNA polymerase subunit F
MNTFEEEKEQEYERRFNPKQFNHMVRLTPENAKQYIGHMILFRTRNQEITKKIIGISPSGRTIQIDHADLKNNLEIVSRKVYVI